MVLESCERAPELNYVPNTQLRQNPPPPTPFSVVSISFEDGLSPRQQLLQSSRNVGESVTCHLHARTIPGGLGSLTQRGEKRDFTFARTTPRGLGSLKLTMERNQRKGKCHYLLLGYRDLTN